METHAVNKQGITVGKWLQMIEVKKQNGEYVNPKVMKIAEETLQNAQGMGYDDLYNPDNLVYQYLLDMLNEQPPNNEEKPWYDGMFNQFGNFGW